jgi:predicted acyl esterase
VHDDMVRDRLAGARGFVFDLDGTLVLGDRRNHGLRQQAFFDHFLKGQDTEVGDWPRVRYQVRDRGASGAWRAAADWPVPGTSYQALFLDALAGTLVRERPGAATSVAYDSERAGRGRGRATFDFRFETQAEVAGGMKPLVQALHDDSVNRGPHVIHAGGPFDSHLLLPVLSGP